MTKFKLPKRIGVVNMTYNQLPKISKPSIHWGIHWREIVFMVLVGFILGTLVGMYIAYSNGLIRNRNMSDLYSEVVDLRKKVPELEKEKKELWMVISNKWNLEAVCNVNQNELRSDN